MRAALAISAALFLWTTFLAPSGSGGSFLEDPIKEKCGRRPSLWEFQGHHYFFSAHRGFDPDETATPRESRLMSWLDARNVCRRRCMDLVSIETEAEFQMMKKVMIRNDLKQVWTSGRLCDFAGCENPVLTPLNINGWFWSATLQRIPPTDVVPEFWSENPWSPTGYSHRPQPDNFELHTSGVNESCIVVLNDAYNDGVTLHDMACYHLLPFICEDSDKLLEQAKIFDYQTIYAKGK